MAGDELAMLLVLQVYSDYCLHKIFVIHDLLFKI